LALARDDEEEGGRRNGVKFENCVVLLTDKKKCKKFAKKLSPLDFR
jgi:hypothetical protein